MTEEQKKKIHEAAKDNKLPCAKAFLLAKQLDLSLKEIGDFCNEDNIRIMNCQLGCFP